MTTRLLGFEDLAYNSMYAQMQRGKTERVVLTAIAAIAATVGRLAQDVCLYSCANFGFVKLPDAFTTGSSIMPHKKNPDIFELTRAKCNRMQALPMEVTLIATNLPSGYFRDMQLTKEIYVPAFKEITDVVRMAKAGIEQMWINRDILANDIYKYLFTVEDVNDAVAKGVPFRDAYREVGMRVQEGTYEHDGRELNHTHEGSIGNLCLDKITAKFERHKFDYTAAIKAEEELMK
jgi:argininosuccinate lyase